MKKSLFVYFTVLLFAFGCSKTETATELINSAESAIEDGKYAKAINSLKKLLEKYPDSQDAPRAQYKLGDAFMAHKKDFNQAIIEYRKVGTQYPESQYAINAQFMLGYVYANYLNDIEAARSEYEKFVELYSGKADEGLIQSVEFELKYLGKDLNEIPTLKHISS